MESLHGGTLLCARGTGSVMFGDWDSGEIRRRGKVSRRLCLKLLLKSQR